MMERCWATHMGTYFHEQNLALILCVVTQSSGQREKLALHFSFFKKLGYAWLDLLALFARTSWGV